MRKSVLVLLFILIVPLAARGDHSVSPNPSTPAQDLSFTPVSGGNMTFIYQTPSANPGAAVWKCSSTVSSTFSASCLTVPSNDPISPPYPAADYSAISFFMPEGYTCEGLGYSECVSDPSRGNGHEYLFSIVAPPPPPPPPSGGGAVPTVPTNESNVASGGFNFKPEIKLSKTLGGTSVSGIVQIDYSGYDKDDDAGQPKYGLGENPVSVFYGSARSSSWTLVADNLPATGTIPWDTSKLSDGENYKIRATIVDKKGYFSELIDDGITVDNTPPAFTVTISPTFSKGEPIKISIESSEPLPKAPILKVAQLKHESVAVELASDNLKKNFVGIYTPVQGFDGPAKISVLGADAAGNKSSVVLEDDTFSVGIKPPPPPVIEAPIGEIKTASTTLPLISGSGLNAQKIIVRVNGTKEYLLQNLKRGGRFSLENIALDPKFNKGRNIISVVSVDKLGIVSEPATLAIFVNSPPEIILLEPRSRVLALNGLINFRWDAYDINDDPLSYQIELSSDGGATWKTLARDLREHHFVWNSTGVPDSSNYLAKITASDGWLEKSILSNRITISNDLPIITLDESGELFTSSKSKTVGGNVRSKNDLLAKLELSLDGGKSWKIIQPEDGKWDSAFEKFSFALPKLKTGSVQKISLKGTSAQNKVVVNAQGLQIVFDDKAPSLITNSLPSRTMTTKFVALEGIALDDFSGIKAVEYKIDDSGWFEATLRGQIGRIKIGFKIDHKEALADGKHEIDIRAVDQAKNLSKTISQKFTIDATPPRIGSFIIRAGDKIIFPNKKTGVFEIKPRTAPSIRFAVAGNPKMVDLKANDERLDIKFNAATKLWESGLTSPEKDGVVSLTVSAEDAAGNKTDKVLAKISVMTIQPQNIPAPVVSGGTTESFWQKILRLFMK